MFAPVAARLPAALVLLWLAAAAAQPEDSCAGNGGTVLVQTELADGFIDWIATRAGWPARQRPQICLVPGERLIAMAVNVAPSRFLVLRALYQTRSHTIFLPADWRPDDIRDQSYLLHELVHHLQIINGVKMPCLAALETQAFALHLEWLSEQGIGDPHAFLDTSPLTIMLLSQCPE